MATAELAVATPAVVLLLVFALSALAAAADQIRCLDAARATARALARGDAQRTAVEQARPLAPAAAVFAVARSGNRVSVRVSAPAPTALAWMGRRAAPQGSAVALLEAAPGGAR